MCAVAVVRTSHTKNHLSFLLIVESLLLAMSFLLRKTWLVCFSVLYSYTEGKEDLNNLLRRKHKLRGVKVSEVPGAESLPGQGKRHSAEEVGGFFPHTLAVPVWRGDRPLVRWAGLEHAEMRVGAGCLPASSAGCPCHNGNHVASSQAGTERAVGGILYYFKEKKKEKK